MSPLWFLPLNSVIPYSAPSHSLQRSESWRRMTVGGGWNIKPPAQLDSLSPFFSRSLCLCLWGSQPEKNVNSAGNRLSGPPQPVWFPVLWGTLLLRYWTSGSADDWKVHPSITIQGRTKQGLAYTETVWGKQQHLGRADVASKQNANWLAGVVRRHANAPAVLSL